MRKISGISRASGLPRPHFQNADPGRHAPCHSRAATTSPSQLSTLPWSTHARHRSNLQRKKQHRHSGIFRVADLGPGTMPRGKYPESPAPAGSHALISRTPTPGGMLHANLGLPRPPPRNFQPPLPRFPSRLSPRRMSGTTVGRILSHPLPWPTHAPATAPNPTAKESPKQKIKAPRAAAPAAACVAGRSTGQHMLPQRLPVQPQKNPQNKTSSCRLTCDAVSGFAPCEGSEFKILSPKMRELAAA